MGNWDTIPPAPFCSPSAPWTGCSKLDASRRVWMTSPLASLTNDRVRNQFVHGEEKVVKIPHL